LSILSFSFFLNTEPDFHPLLCCIFYVSLHCTTTCTSQTSPLIIHSLRLCGIYYIQSFYFFAFFLNYLLSSSFFIYILFIVFFLLLFSFHIHYHPPLPITFFFVYDDRCRFFFPPVFLPVGRLAIVTIGRGGLMERENVD